MKPRLIKPVQEGAGRAGVPAGADGMPVITFGSEEGAFYLSADGVQVEDKPAFSDYESAMRCAVYMEDKAPFWKADLLEYGSKRPDWAGLLDSVIDAGTFTASTVSQYRYIARAVPAEQRVAGLSFSHHEAVASLPGSDKKHYLLKAKREHLSVSALKQVIRKERKVRRVLKGQASEVARAHNAVAEAAHAAAEACRAIPLHDCKDADKQLKAARRHLDTCESAVAKLRKATGGK